MKAKYSHRNVTTRERFAYPGGMVAMVSALLVLLCFSIMVWNPAPKEKVSVNLPETHPVDQPICGMSTWMELTLEENGTAHVGFTSFRQEVYFKEYKTSGLEYAPLEDKCANELQALILMAQEADPEIRISLKADENVPYYNIKNVFDSLEELDIHKLHLVTNAGAYATT